MLEVGGYFSKDFTHNLILWNKYFVWNEFSEGKDHIALLNILFRKSFVWNEFTNCMEQYIWSDFPEFHCYRIFIIQTFHLEFILLLLLLLLFVFYFLFIYLFILW